MTVKLACCWAAPGQLMTYFPGWRDRANPPDSPGVRFSCSPRMWDRSFVRSSASDTALAPLFATLNWTWPVVTFAGFGAHPLGVRLTLTVASLPSAPAGAANANGATTASTRPPSVPPRIPRRRARRPDPTRGEVTVARDVLRALRELDERETTGDCSFIGW